VIESLPRDRFLVTEMLRHLGVIAMVAASGKESLAKDPSQRYALEHACELLAEAAKHTSREFRSLNSSVSWRALRALRTAVAHPYDLGASPVQMERLWHFVVEEGPRLKRQLERAKFPR
jgi:uncharacterized protein with HEPN domain